MRNFKIKVESESHSKEIQQRVFDNDIIWNSHTTKKITNVESPHLLVQGNTLYHTSSNGYFENSPIAEARLLHDEHRKLIKKVILIQLNAKSDDSIYPVWQMTDTRIASLKETLKDGFYFIKDMKYLNQMRDLILANELKFTYNETTKIHK